VYNITLTYCINKHVMNVKSHSIMLRLSHNTYTSATAATTAATTVFTVIAILAPVE